MNQPGAAVKGETNTTGDIQLDNPTDDLNSIDSRHSGILP
jgi:hypothetical protein